MRLWKYEKGRPPSPKASPRSATRFEGHFADPGNRNKEVELENRLNRQIEEPVNAFIDTIRYATFVLTSSHIRKLARYITLLFTRSRARREATKYQRNLMLGSMNSLLSNPAQLEAVAAKFMKVALAHGQQPLTKDEVTDGIRKLIEAHNADDQLQRNYVESVEVMLVREDDDLLFGHWGVLRTGPEDPFVIGDAPVVTWERAARNRLMFGQGFGRPNVEVLVPVCPTECIHVLPQVERTRSVLSPATLEVNMAQASFATRNCFTNVRSLTLDASLQEHFGRTRLGENAFTLGHIDYTNKLFDILMNQPG